MTPPHETARPVSVRDARPAAVRLHDGNAATAERFLTAWAAGDLGVARVFVVGPTDAPCGVLIAYLVGPGQGAIWPPRADDAETVRALSVAADAWFRAEGVVVVQVVVPPASRRHAEWLPAIGYHPVTDLLLMVDRSNRSVGSHSTSATSIDFRPASPVDPLFADVLEQTYVGTLDVPELNGRRGTVDVIAGYLAAWNGNTPDWWLAVRDGRPVGVVMLGPPEPIPRELTYLGLIPDVRGEGLGRLLLEWAVDRAGPGLLVNVDARNEPAVRLYTRFGFRTVDRWGVYLKFLDHQ